jgi:hypothetical protein
MNAGIFSAFRFTKLTRAPGHQPTEQRNILFRVVPSFDVLVGHSFMLPLLGKEKEEGERSDLNAPARSLAQK